MTTLYWVGGSANWDATAGTKWALTSGGAGGQPIPTATDDVILDAASGAVTVTISGTRVAKSLTASAFTGTIAGTATPLLNLSGDLILGTGLTFNPTTGPATISILAAANIDTAGRSIRALLINAPGVTVTLTSPLNCSSSLTLTAGTFDANDFAVTILSFLSSANSNVRTVNCGTGIWTVTGSSTGFDASSSSNLTFNHEGGTWIFNGSTSLALTASVALNITFNNLEISGGGSTVPNVTFTNINWAGVFTLIAPRRLILAANSTGTGTATLVFSGYSVNTPFVLQSNASGTARTLTTPVGSTTTFPAGAIRDIVAAGGTFVANDNYNMGQNTGITFNAPASTAAAMVSPINSDRLVA